MLFIVAQRWSSLHHASPKAGLCWVLLEAIQSEGNLGSLIRTSEAVGGAGFILTGLGDPIQLNGANETANYMETLGVRPLLGRLYRPLDRLATAFELGIRDLRAIDQLLQRDLDMLAYDVVLLHAFCCDLREEGLQCNVVEVRFRRAA